MQITPRFSLSGQGGEAAELYREAFGLAPAKKKPNQGEIRLESGDMSIRVSDGTGQTEERLALEVSFHYSDDAQHAFDTLMGDGGRVRAALGETAENHLYGSVTDRFGVTWHIILE